MPPGRRGHAEGATMVPNAATEAGAHERTLPSSGWPDLTEPKET